MLLNTQAAAHWTRLAVDVADHGRDTAILLQVTTPMALALLPLHIHMHPFQVI